MTDAFIYESLAEPRRCPVCHQVAEVTTGISLDPAVRRPTLRVGNVSLCYSCKSILVLTTIGFRVAEDADIERLSPNIRRLLFAMSGGNDKRPT